MNGLYGVNVQMALMSQVFLPKIHMGFSKTSLNVLFVRRISLQILSKERPVFMANCH